MRNISTAKKIGDVGQAIINWYKRVFKSGKGMRSLLNSDAGDIDASQEGRER
jgi:hypothetical protein